MSKNTIFGMGLGLMALISSCGSDSNSNNADIAQQQAGLYNNQQYWQTGQVPPGYVAGQPFNNGINPYFMQGCSNPLLCGPRFNHFGPQGYVFLDYGTLSSYRWSYSYRWNSRFGMHYYGGWPNKRNRLQFPCEINQGVVPAFQGGVAGNTGVWVRAGQVVSIEAEGVAQLSGGGTIPLSATVVGNGGTQKIFLNPNGSGSYQIQTDGQLYLGFEGAGSSQIRAHSVRIYSIR